MGRTLRSELILRPSAAGEWGRPNGCPGSVVMQNQYPETGTNEAAEHGDAAHWLAAELLTARTNGAPLQAAQFVGRAAPNGVTVTDEMADAVTVYVDDVVVICADRGFLPALRIEKGVKVQRVHPTQCVGTYDGGAILYDEIACVLYIWDFKFGFLPVEAFENWQALCYAIGLLDEITGGNGLTDQNIFIEIRIVQPRIWHVEGPVRKWRLRGSDLRSYANILAGNAALALSDDPPTRAGDQCRFCSARVPCETQRRDAYAAMSVAGTATPQDMPDDALATEHHYLTRAAKALEYRLTGVEAQIIERIESGHAVPGKVITQGYGRQKFKDGAEKIVEPFAAQLNLMVRKPAQLITPKQCISAGVPKSFIDANSFTPVKGMKLADSTTSLAARVFSRRQS